jgi:hypothetical protein
MGSLGMATCTVGVQLAVKSALSASKQPNLPRPAETGRASDCLIASIL